MAEEEPIIAFDGTEHWVLYPEDNAYKLVAALPKENDVYVLSPELVKKLSGWWYDEAKERVMARLQMDKIPWDKMTIDENDATVGATVVLSEKLALITYHIVQVNNELTMALVEQKLLKEAVDHAVALKMGRNGDSGGTVAVRTSLAISSDRRLRTGFVKLAEVSATVMGLEQMKNGLDTLWRTVSRVLSARLAEPVG